jgi:hypothetical protein
LPPAYLLVLAEIISSTLKMEAMCSSETSVATQQTTWRHIPEDDTLQKLELIEQLELGVFVVHVCEEYGHLDLMDISNIGHPLPTVSPLNRGYTVQ